MSTPTSNSPTTQSNSDSLNQSQQEPTISTTHTNPGPISSIYPNHPYNTILDHPLPIIYPAQPDLTSSHSSLTQQPNSSSNRVQPINSPISSPPPHPSPTESLLLPSSNSSPATTQNSPSPLPATIRHPMKTRSQHGIVKPKVRLDLSVTYNPTTEPTCYTAASRHLPWRKAMYDEFSALTNQGTWSLIPRPSNRTIVGCKWIYRLKFNFDGSLARHKARLVAKGFHQTEGLDYNETFSPVIKHTTIRVVLSLSLHYGWATHQLDVSNAFLHGLLEEEVLMEQPQGFINPEYLNHVCRLHKAIYGLKQASRAWFSLFSSFLVNHQFKISSADTSLFIRNQDNHITLVLVYVDDIIVTGSSSTQISSLILAMKAAFAMKELGSLNYFLGIEVLRTPTGLILSQSRYAASILDKAGMTEAKPYASPTASKTTTSLSDDTAFSDPQLYRSIVGSLQYLTITRPDLTYAVNQVCQYMHAPKLSHFAAVKRLLRYVKGTLDSGFHFQQGPLDIIAYSDADWAGDREDRRSTTGYCIFLGPNLISWCAKKQPTVARSSTEAEYRSLAHTAAEITWLKKLLHDLCIVPSHTPLLWCDNLSAISLASNPIFHARTKHIEIDYHFIREKVVNKEIQVSYVSTIDQLADLFTKSLPAPRFKYLLSKLNVSEVPFNLRGRNSNIKHLCNQTVP